MTWLLWFEWCQFRPKPWVLTCKNSYLEELIRLEKVEKSNFCEKPCFDGLAVRLLGWVLPKNSYLKVLLNVFWMMKNILNIYNRFIESEFRNMRFNESEKIMRKNVHSKTNVSLLRRQKSKCVTFKTKIS